MEQTYERSKKTPNNAAERYIRCGKQAQDEQTLGFANYFTAQ
jgi:hypothetical protein